MSYIRPHLVDEPHWVYKIYDPEDRLLYIGCTVHYPRNRIINLRGENPKAARAPLHHWEAWLYESGPVAEATEGRLIDLFDPPLNRHRSGVASRKLHALSPHIAADKGLVSTHGRWPQRQSA